MQLKKNTINEKEKKNNNNTSRTQIQDDDSAFHCFPNIHTLFLFWCVCVFLKKNIVWHQTFRMRIGLVNVYSGWFLSEFWSLDEYSYNVTLIFKTLRVDINKLLTHSVLVYIDANQYFFLYCYVLLFIKIVVILRPWLRGMALVLMKEWREANRKKENNHKLSVSRKLNFSLLFCVVFLWVFVTLEDRIVKVWNCVKLKNKKKKPTKNRKLTRDNDRAFHQFLKIHIFILFFFTCVIWSHNFFC